MLSAAVRTFIRTAKLTLPLKTAIELKASNILLDENEINGEFILDGNTESETEILDYLKKQGFEIIAGSKTLTECENYEFKKITTKVYHFRIKI